MSSEAHPTLATFRVHRAEDVSGVSGTGVIAEGVQFSTGWVVTHWLDQPPMWEPKTDVWYHKGTGPITKVHGHGGATRIVWTRDEEKRRRELAADVAEAFDVPGWVAGPAAELGLTHRRVMGALLDAHHGRTHDQILSSPTGHCSHLADAVMPIVAELLEQARRERATVGRAYALAERWKAAHGSSNLLVRAAGTELGEVLAENGDVVHSEAEAQANGLSEADDSALVCVCGDPVDWMDHSGGSGWIHTPGSETKCLEARPRCPECRVPHDIRPHEELLCRILLPRQSRPKQEDGVAAAECSAQHHGFPGDHRQCIRAAQHRGDHIDASGFHWSDTIAMYPVETCWRQQQARTCTSGDTDSEPASAARPDMEARERRVRSVVKVWAPKVLPRSEAHNLLTDLREALDGLDQPQADEHDICTATVPDAPFSTTLARCVAQAGHYDPGEMPDFRGSLRDPAGWHRDSQRVWSDDAAGATPHRTEH
ncbi:hypothetical protein [Streptomyces sp. NPDC059759]|uniref:hypothetical protein n=1 Tax=Streptomyces sp. NPDC059759 TaxID=3346936 RepID=UPI00365834F8